MSDVPNIGLHSVHPIQEAHPFAHHHQRLAPPHRVPPACRKSRGSEFTEHAEAMTLPKGVRGRSQRGLTLSCFRARFTKVDISLFFSLSLALSFSLSGPGLEMVPNPQMLLASERATSLRSVSTIQG